MDIYIVDAFADQVFLGNQAGVVFITGERIRVGGKGRISLECRMHAAT